MRILLIDRIALQHEVSLINESIVSTSNDIDVFTKIALK